MIRTLKIAPSIASLEPCPLYFERVASMGLRAAECGARTEGDAWDLCEYLDAMDAGDLPIHPPDYQKCVAALADYLVNTAEARVDHPLGKKSWAAKTLLELMELLSLLPEHRIAWQPAMRVA